MLLKGDAAAALVAMQNESSKPQRLGGPVAYRDPGLADISIEPCFANLHQDPRWMALLLKLGKAPEQLTAIKFDLKLPR